MLGSELEVLLRHLVVNIDLVGNLLIRGLVVFRTLNGTKNKVANLQ